MAHARVDEARTHEVAAALLRAADRDTEYRDRYLRRAVALLRPVMPPERLGQIRDTARRLHAAEAEIEHAVLVEDWERVARLARIVESGERQRGAEAPLRAVAEQVYAALGAPAGPEAIPAFSYSGKGVAGMQDAIRTVLDALGVLEHADVERRSFYAARHRVLERTLAAAESDDAAIVPAATRRTEALDALHAGRWDTLVRIAAHTRAPHGASSSAAGECDCAALAAIAPSLDLPFEVGAAAERLGLRVVHLDARLDLSAYLACRCTRTPRFADTELTPETRAPIPTVCHCHDSCPDLSGDLRDTLDLLKHGVFATSLGTRYLPAFQPESLLVEAFPDDAAGEGALPARLGLGRREELSRREIEAAIGWHGAEVLDDLGLDPLEYVLTLVPFDAYLRLSPALQWGRRAAWTHFDGYQVLHGWRVRALVGGHSRYGGPSDLCSLSRMHEHAGVLARFAVVRRQRLQLHVGQRQPDA